MTNKKPHSLPRLMIVSSGKEHQKFRGLASDQVKVLTCSLPVIFQLREKNLDTADLHSLACDIAPVIEAAGSILCINERFDIALATGAGGVHLPEASCPADVVRKTVPGLITGKSVHSHATALAAAGAGIDYLLFGPVFETPSKAPYGPPQGLDKLREICRAVAVPVFAVGGITPDKTAACLECGAWGVAAMAPFLDPLSLPETINHFRSYFFS